MNIEAIYSTEFEEVTPETRVSKLVGRFGDPSVPGVVVRGDEYEGVVTRRQLATSHHPAAEKVRSLVWHVPRLAPDEDVRLVAKLMLDSDARILPVFEGRTLVGVVTVDDVLRAVQEYLDAATVADAFTDELVTVTPETTFGEALHDLREHRIAHLPVVEDGDAVGILSLYDVVDLTVRASDKSQGGEGGGTDAFGGDISASSGRSRRGGFGAREGELERVLDLPVRDVMVSPVRTIERTATLEDAVEEMFDVGGSSLVVVDGGSPVGILTKSDVLDALTWEAEDNRVVQVYGTDLLDDVTYEEVVELIDGLDDKDHAMSVIDAKVHLQKHDEKYRGTPLVLARIRLHTDRGLYMASGEGYGASHALNEARDVLERRIRDRKTRGRSKKHQDGKFWAKRFGWWLEG